MDYFPENKNDWRKIALLVDRAENVYISCHINPDGDAIGSEMALAGFLKKMGKNVKVYNQSVTPEVYRFLDSESIIESFPVSEPNRDKPNASDLVIFLDMGNIYRAGNCGNFLADSPAAVVVIDHHPPEEITCDVKAVNTSAASTGSLVYDLISHIDPSLIDKTIAISLMTAIVTDSGYFRYDSTTSVTHLIAAELHKRGARESIVRKKLEVGYPFFRQKLLGLALNNARLEMDGRLVYAHLTLPMFQELGARREHTEGIIDQLRIIQGVRLAALIIQEGEDEYKVSFRSTGKVSVNALASILGGGGHRRAAGATLYGSLEEVTSRMVKEAVALLKGKRK